MVAREAHNLEVLGSNPSPATEISHSLSINQKNVYWLICLPRSHVEDRFDGQTWRIFDLPRGRVVIISCGQELVHRNPEFLDLLHDYRNEVMHPRRANLVRRWFRAGGNIPFTFWIID